MGDALLIDSRQIRENVVRDLEKRYPGFSSFPDLAIKWDYLRENFGSEIDNIHRYCGPKSVVVDKIVGETLMYAAHLGILKEMTVLVDGNSATDLNGLDSLFPDCAVSYGEAFDISGRKVIVCETDRVRDSLNRDLCTKWPGLERLEGICLDVEEYLPLVDTSHEFGKSFRLEKHVGKYSGAMSKATYAATFRSILRGVADGHCVIFDGTNTRFDGLDKVSQIAKAARANLAFVWCQASDNDVALNVQARKREETFSEATESRRERFLEDHASELAKMGDILSDFCVYTGCARWYRVRTRDESVVEAFKYLRKLSREGNSLIVMVGEPLTGKTWLANRIIEGNLT